MYSGLRAAFLIVVMLGLLTVPAQPLALAAEISLSLLPSQAGTVSIVGAGDPAATLRLSIDSVAVKTCVGSPCSHEWNGGALSQTVAARTLDAIGRVLGEAWTKGLSPAFVSVAVPSVASGVVTIEVRAEPTNNVDIRLDGTLLKNCGATTCSHAWDTRTATNGTHVISVKAHDSSVATETQAYVKTTVSNPLTAGAGADQAGNEGASLPFTGTATGGTGPYAFAWTFGDGTSGSGASVSHVYRDNGSFTATLTVTDATGQTASDTAAVTVANVAPTANVGGPYSAVVGSPLAFSGSATDPSAEDTVSGFTFVWDFGDGVTGVNASPSHVYAATGTYTVSLIVIDKDGGSRSVTTTAAIVPPPLTASAGPDQAGNEGASLQITGSATGGTGPYAFAWTFGDGTSGSGASVTHAYRDNGSFTATLTVTDATGQTASDTAAVTMANVAPTANAGGPYSAVAGSPIAFNGSATDPSADDTGSGFTFAWDFGDGVTGGNASPSHAYAAPGTYTISLTVSDKDGGSRLVTTTAVIAPLPLTVGAGPNQAGNEGASFQFTGVATGGIGPYAFAWTFGDGTSGSGASVSHVYRDNGSFTATLTVTDATGQTASDTAAVTVANVAPAANAGGPYIGLVGSAIAFSGSATDPSAEDTESGFTYAWNFGDGVSVLDASPSHAYVAAGTYTVSLTVIDKNGGSRSVTTTAVIHHQPLTVDDQGGNEGASVAAEVSLSLLPSQAGTVSVRGAGNPAATLRLSMDSVAVKTCAGSPCLYEGNAGALSQTVVARTLDAMGRVLGEAWAKGVRPAFVSVAVPSMASGVVTIEAQAEPATSVDIRLDGTLLKNCPGTTCSHAWDSRTATNGIHVISVKAHDDSDATEMVAYVKTTVSNGRVALWLRPPAPGTVAIQATGDPAATLRLSIDDVPVQTCDVSPCSHALDAGPGTTLAQTVRARALDATDGVLGEATVRGVRSAFVSVAVPSVAAGVVTIVATAEPAASVDIQLDDALLTSCSGTTCSYAWDTTTVANGSYTIWVTGRDDSAATEVVAYAKTTVANGRVALSLLPAGAGTVTIQATGDPEEKQRISIDQVAVKTCPGSPCSHAWNTGGSTSPHTVATRMLDPTNRVLGEAWVKGLVPGFVSVAVPSVASGVVTIEGKAEPATHVDIRLDGVLLKNCRGTTCSHAWDTRTAANGAHVISVKAHPNDGVREMVAYVKMTIVNPTTGQSGPPSTGSDPGSTTGGSGSTSGGSSVPPVNYPVYAVPNLPRPEFLQPMLDSVFGTTITRVTDPLMGSERGYRHEHARLAALNADNTKAVVRRMSNGSYQVIELATGTILRTVPQGTCGGRTPSMNWHREDPDLLIYLCANQVRTLQVSTGVVTTLMRFDEYQRVETREGTVSDDWSSVALFATRPDGGTEVVVADLNTQTIIARDSSLALGNWIGVSPSGQYVVIQHGGTTGTRVYDRNLTYLRTLHLDWAQEDFAIDADGQDVLVWFAKTGPQSAPFGYRSVIAKGRLSDGQTTEIIDTRWKWGGHVSGIGSRGRPGWILVSNSKAVTYPPNDAPFLREIFWVKMDGSGAVRRLAHHHSDLRQCPEGSASTDYFAEPHAVSSWDGTRVVFASVWGEGCTRYDMYVIDSSWVE